ncbi:MAG: hypothetical protein K2N89_05960 [Lachnospiraceae bacterium]|nr:hypothetical protein [Lachnospiraceae bacterium]
MEREKNKKRKKYIKPTDFVYLGAIALMLLLVFGYKARQEMLSRLSPGDEVTFGTYLDEPIVWRVLKVERNHAVLVSDQILTMKAFDAAESGVYALDDTGGKWLIDDKRTLENLEMQEYTHGTNDWSRSDIRTWLNSNHVNVVYEGNGPAGKSMAEEKNGYLFEAGFLSGFSDKEQEAIILTHNVTKGNVLSDGDVETDDLVYLPSLDELEWFYDANVNVFAVPTDSAIERDETNSYKIYSVDWGLEPYVWWLRDPVEGSSSKVHAVNNGYGDKLLIERIAGIGGNGVRPVVTVDVRKFTELKKTPLVQLSEK